jgi:hypothetical protein
MNIMSLSDGASFLFKVLEAFSATMDILAKQKITERNECCCHSEYTLDKHCQKSCHLSSSVKNGLHSSRQTEHIVQLK